LPSRRIAAETRSSVGWGEVNFAADVNRPGQFCNGYTRANGLLSWIEQVARQSWGATMGVSRQASALMTLPTLRSGGRTATTHT
jgi:hypothetical protein